MARPGCYNPGKDKQHPLYRRLGRNKSQSELAQKILLPLGFDPQTVQPLTSCYTDYAILALIAALYIQYPI